MSRSANADIIVIGSGTIGTAIAYYLTKYHPGKIILIEKNSLGSGATSWAASLINRIRTKETHIKMVLETYRAIEELEMLLGTSLGAREVGCIHIASSEQSKVYLDHLIALSKQYSVRGEKLLPAEIQHFLPWINKKEVKSGFYMPDDLFIDGYILASSYARMAKNLGASVIQQKEVVEILADNGKVIGVKLDDGSTISTQTVIHAGGAWSNLLLTSHLVKLPMAPVRSVYWLTKPMPVLFPHSMPITFIPDAGVYTRPESGAMLFGIRDMESKNFNPKDLPDEYNGYSFISDEAQWKILLNEGKRFKSFFSDLFETPLIRSVSGLSTYTPDGNPIIGKSKYLDGYYAATGCNGAGIALSGGYGRLIKNMILEEKPFVDCIDFDVDRFNDIDPFSKAFGKLCSVSRAGKRNGG